MKYYVSVNGEDHEVALDEHGVQVDGEPVTATVESINGSPGRMVTIGDEVHRVVVRQAGRGAYTLWLDGYRFEVEALDERARAIRELSRRKAADFRTSQVGRNMRAITLARGGSDWTEALTSNYLKVRVPGCHEANLWIDVEVGSEPAAQPAAEVGLA